MKNKLIVFTDLDGTLLDYYTYSYKYSRKGMDLLRRFDIPLIFCTSKSYAEVVYFREKTGNESPFIVENGGAVYIPEKQFKKLKRFQGSHRSLPFKSSEGYVAIELGTDYRTLRHVFEQMKKKFGNGITGFGDMSDQEVASYLNLQLDLAAMAKDRRHDEPFIIKKESLLDGIKQFSMKHGLKVYAGTRFYHLMGNTDKGKAVKVLASIYRETVTGIITAGIGEGKNDEPMFREVDLPYLVEKPDGKHIDISMDNIVKINEIGPEGFTLAVEELLKKEGFSYGI